MTGVSFIDLQATGDGYRIGRQLELQLAELG